MVAGESEEGSLQRDSLTSTQLYSCMAYNHHDRFLSFSLAAVVLSDTLHGQEKADTCSSSKGKYEFSKYVYAFIVYGITANGGGTSRDSFFNSMNELS